ncbi:MAG: hypothetical protein R2757_02845 [Draconibacterium sp.]
MNKTDRIVTIILWVLILISTVLVVSLMVNISDVDEDPTMGRWINSILIWSYILVGVGAGIAILAGLFHAITDRSAAKKSVISIVFLGAVVIIAYLVASPAIPQFPGVDKFINDGTLTEKISKWVDTGLYATYILLGIAILSILFSSVTRLFK